MLRRNPYSGPNAEFHQCYCGASLQSCTHFELWELWCPCIASWIPKTLQYGNYSPEPELFWQCSCLECFIFTLLDHCTYHNVELLYHHRGPFKELMDKYLPLTLPQSIIIHHSIYSLIETTISWIKALIKRHFLKSHGGNKCTLLSKKSQSKKATY